MSDETQIERLKDHFQPLIASVKEQSKQQNNADELQSYMFKVDQTRIESLKEFSRTNQSQDNKKSQKEDLETWTFLIHEFQEPLQASSNQYKALEMNQQIKETERKSKSTSESRSSLRESLSQGYSGIQGITPCAKAFKKISNFGLSVIKETDSPPPMSEKSIDKFRLQSNGKDNMVSSAKKNNSTDNKNFSDSKSKRMLSKRGSRKSGINIEVSKFNTLAQMAIQNDTFKQNQEYKSKKTVGLSPKLIDKKRNSDILEMTFTKSQVKSQTFTENLQPGNSCTHNKDRQIGGNDSPKKLVIIYHL